MLQEDRATASAALALGSASIYQVLDIPISRTLPSANPPAAGDVAAAFRNYFSRHLGRHDLAYLKKPEELSDGWETYTYSLQFQSSTLLPPCYDRPLILRIYSDRQGLPRARHEYAVQRHLLRLGFPITEPLLLEEDCGYFGAPFLLRAQAQGQTLFRALLARPWRLWWDARRMGALHAHLHDFPAEGFPSRPGYMLTRSLDEIAAAILAGSWKGLAPGLDWLVANRPAPPKVARILHLDFHPMNLIRQDDGSLVPIDWPESDVGDRHADVGTTLMLLECVSAKDTTFLDRLAVGAGRYWHARWYLKGYCRRQTIDWATLAYYRAWAALVRLCRYGKWLNGGPASGLCKPAALDQLGSENRGILERYFQKWTGIAIRF